MDFNVEAETWDDQEYRVERSRRIAESIRSALDLTNRPRTLELGSGTGLLARALADTLGPVTLADNAPKMVQVGLAKAASERHTDWDGVVVDLGVDPLPDGPYGLIISQLALHHLGDVAALLRDLFAVLEAGGRVALVDLDHDPEGLFHDGHAADTVHNDEHEATPFDGHNGFERETIEQWLADAGFSSISLTTATEIRKEVAGVERAFPLFLATATKA